MQKRLMADGSWIYWDGAAMMQTFDLGEGVLMSVCRGTQNSDHAAHIIADGEGQLKRFGRVVFMVDAVESPRMSTEFRDQMTTWFKDNKSCATVHMLIRSKMLEMALNVANLVIGAAAARAYSSASEWEAAGRKLSPGFRRRPLTVPDDLETSSSL